MTILLVSIMMLLHHLYTHNACMNQVYRYLLLLLLLLLIIDEIVNFVDKHSDYSIFTLLTTF